MIHIFSKFNRILTFAMDHKITADDRKVHIVSQR